MPRSRSRERERDRGRRSRSRDKDAGGQDRGREGRRDDSRPGGARSRSRSWSLDSLGRKRRRGHRSPTRGSNRREAGFDRRRRSWSREGRDHRDVRENRDIRENRDVRDSRDFRLNRDNRGVDRREREREDFYGGHGQGAQAFRSRILNEGQDKGASNEEEDEVVTGDLSEEQQIAKLLGFSSFDSTKGKPITDNQKTAARGATRKNQKREYRQYMNRRGGFNRPLS